MAEMLIDRPDMMRFFSRENNPDIVPSKIKTCDRVTLIHWCCPNPKCGYEWTTTPKVRAKSTGQCPVCEAQKVIKDGVNDVFTLYPRLRDYLRPGTNPGISLTGLSFKSDQVLTWTCPDCGKEFRSSIRTRTQKGEDGIYHVIECRHTSRISPRKPEDVPFCSEIPELARFYSPENPLPANEVRSNSPVNVLLRCPDCGIEWRKSPKRFMETSRNCICCGLEKPKVYLKGVNDIFTRCPSAEPYFNWEKNEGYDIFSHPTHDIRKHKLWWLCPDCGHSWLAFSGDMINGSLGSYEFSGCPQCNKKALTLKYHSVATKPYLMNIWDTEKNTLRPDQISVSSKEKVHWHCRVCDYDWIDTIENTDYRKGKCPWCTNTGKLCRKGYNDVKTLVPDITQFADPDYDTADSLSEVTPWNCTNKLHFRCPECGFTQYTFASHLVEKSSDGSYKLLGCIKCGYLNKKGTQSQRYPELAAMYSPKNDKPFNLLIGETGWKERHFWNCPDCGHEFSSTLSTILTSISEGKGNHGCSFCSGLLVAYEDTFGVVHENDLMRDFESSDADPFSISCVSDKDAVWHCEFDPSHKWHATFRTRHLDNGRCPYCWTTTLGGEYVKTFACAYPKEAAYMVEDPTKIAYNSNVLKHWVCPVCYGVYADTIEEYLNGNPCPYCSNQSLLSGFNDLASMHPEVVHNFAPDNNRPPSEVLYTITERFRWICRRCGGVFGQDLDSYLLMPDCPYCDGRLPLAGLNTVADLYHHPTISFGKTNPKKAYEVVATTTYLYKWDCSACGGTFSAAPRDMNEEYQCPYCSGKRLLPGVNSFRVRGKTPPTITFSSKNATDDDSFLPSYALAMKWDCSTCGGTFSAAPRDMNEDFECPYCSGKRLLPGVNSFRVRGKTPPTITFSSKNATDDDSFLPSYVHAMKWDCSTCGGTFSAAPRDMNEDFECPYCSGKRLLPGVNSFRVRGKTPPTITFSSKNAADDDSFLPSYALAMKWDCSTCGGTFSAAPRDMNEEYQCPYCSGRKILPGYNSFAVLYRDTLMVDWPLLLNYAIVDPDTVGPTSTANVFWPCNNPYHPKDAPKYYQMSIKERVENYFNRQREACRYCKGRRLKQVHFVQYSLDDETPEV